MSNPLICECGELEFFDNDYNYICSYCGKPYPKIQTDNSQKKIDHQKQVDEHFDEWVKPTEIILSPSQELTENEKESIKRLVYLSTTKETMHDDEEISEQARESSLSIDKMLKVIEEVVDLNHKGSKEYDGAMNQIKELLTERSRIVSENEQLQNELKNNLVISNKLRNENDKLIVELKKLWSKDPLRPMTPEEIDQFEIDSETKLDGDIPSVLNELSELVQYVNQRNSEEKNSVKSDKDQLDTFAWLNFESKMNVVGDFLWFWIPYVLVASGLIGCILVIMKMIYENC